MNDLSAFQRDIIYAIGSIESPAGVDIKTRLENKYGDIINETRLYRNLQELTKQGYITKRSKDGRTNEYHWNTQTRNLVQQDLTWKQECLNSTSESREKT